MKEECIDPKNRGLQLFEDPYEMLALRDVFQEKQIAANEVLEKAADVIQSIGIGEDIRNRDTKIQYIADLSDDMVDAIEKGIIKLDTNKNHEIFAQMKNGNRYGKKIPLRKELVENGIDPLELSMALQLKTIEDKLSNVIETLDEIGEDIEEVAQGQQNDRIGLYFSGRELYLEARTVQDSGFRDMLTAQALKALNDAKNQLFLELRDDVFYLVDEKYKQKKSNSVKSIKEKIKNINKCFDVIHRISIMKAAIYYERNELSAMLATMKDYQRFLSTTIVPFAPKLSECDESDTLLRNGKWESRAKMLGEIETLQARIEENCEHYLYIGDNNEERQAK